jgi:hypothetical protein
MFVDEANKAMVLKAYVGGPTNHAQRYLDVVAAKTGGKTETKNDSGGEQVLLLAITLGALRGYNTQLHLYACTFPSTPSGRQMVAKGADGVIVVGSAAAATDVADAANEMKKHVEENGATWAALPRALVALGEAAPALASGALAGVVVSACDEQSAQGAMDAVKAVTSQILKASTAR